MTVVCLMVSGSMMFLPPPTARMASWGALMMAVNSAIPNIPRLEMVKVPPWNSSSLSLFSLALLASSLTSAEICWIGLLAASLTIGVMRPLGVATATEMSILLE